MAGVVWATKKWFRGNPDLNKKATEMLREIYREFGLRSRLAAPFVGRYINRVAKREALRLQRGCTYEPPTFYEINPVGLLATAGSRSQLTTEK